MMFLAKQIMKTILLPPGVFIVLLIAALVLLRFRRRVAALLIAFVTAGMAVLSMPAVGQSLLWTLVKYRPLDLRAIPGDAGAIVVLTGGVYRAPEYGREIPTGKSVQRARYAAFLHRETSLPLVVVGGKPRPQTISEAEAMRVLLEDEWRVPVKWLEETAKDTEDSARNAFAILSRHGIRKILLVTGQFHMARAEDLFRSVGFEVVPAALGFPRRNEFSVRDFMPRAGVMGMSTSVMNEWLGLAWYSIKNAFSDG